MPHCMVYLLYSVVCDLQFNKNKLQDIYIGSREGEKKGEEKDAKNTTRIHDMGVIPLFIYI